MILKMAIVRRQGRINH